jgi:hypothetical protein
MFPSRCAPEKLNVVFRPEKSVALLIRPDEWYSNDHIARWP